MAAAIAHHVPLLGVLEAKPTGLGQSLQAGADPVVQLGPVALPQPGVHVVVGQLGPRADAGLQRIAGDS